MRDDLHRTPTLTRSWKTAVRHAERAADHDRISYDLSRAAVQEMSAHVREEWVAGLKQASGGEHGQLFPESRLEALSTYEGSAKTHWEQKLLEIARAICLQRPDSLDIVDTSVRVVHQLVVESNIEHITASVRQHKGAKHARELRACLVEHKAGCMLDLGQQKPPKKPKGKALLDMEAPAP